MSDCTPPCRLSHQLSALPIGRSYSRIAGDGRWGPKTRSLRSTPAWQRGRTASSWTSTCRPTGKSSSATTRRFGVDLEHVWAGERGGIPTLRAVLGRYRDAPVIIEIKTGTPEAARAVVEVVRDVGAVDRVCVGSFSLIAVQAVRIFEPKIPTSGSRKEGQLALYRSWLGLSPGRVAYRAFQVPEQAGRLRVVTPRFVRAVHRANVALQVWTVNEESDMRRLLGWGVDGIITDRPDVGARVRDDERRTTRYR